MTPQPQATPESVNALLNRELDRLDRKLTEWERRRSYRFALLAADITAAALRLASR